MLYGYLMFAKVYNCLSCFYKFVWHFTKNLNVKSVIPLDTGTRCPAKTVSGASLFKGTSEVPVPVRYLLICEQNCDWFLCETLVVLCIHLFHYLRSNQMIFSGKKYFNKFNFFIMSGLLQCEDFLMFQKALKQLRYVNFLNNFLWL
jgi:hypothetical protein